MKALISTAALAFALLGGAAIPNVAEAQCAQCTGTVSEPCQWGPFIDGGATKCRKDPESDGCFMSGNCLDTFASGKDASDFLGELRIAPDGFALSPLAYFVSATMAEFHESGVGSSVASMCRGLLLAIRFDAEAKRSAEHAAAVVVI